MEPARILGIRRAFVFQAESGIAFLMRGQDLGDELEVLANVPLRVSTAIPLANDETVGNEPLTS